MALIPIKTPFIIKKIFPHYVWDITSDKKVIYLTFDDGPTPEITHWVLDVLNQYQAKATFFCIGNNIEKHPAIFREILNQGHAVGNHTHNHLKGWQTQTKAYIDNITKAAKVMRLQTQNTTLENNNLFRPPYGQITPKQGKKLKALDYKIIMWDVLSFDWDRRVSPKKCLKNLILKTKKGSIVVFHDSIKASVSMQYTLPKLLAHFSAKGYVFKSLTF